MAIIEAQIRTDRFCELVKGEINSRPLPSPMIDQLDTLEGKYLERIECRECAFLESNFDDGVVTLNAMLAFLYHNNLDDVRAAGSLVAPVPKEKIVPFRVRFKIDFVPLPSPHPVLTFDLLAFGLRSVMSGAFPVKMPDDLPIVKAAIVANDSVVAMRFATVSTDATNALPTDRLAGQEWIQCVPGSLIADMVRAILDQALDAAVVPPPPPDPNKPWLPKPKAKVLRKDGPATVAWVPLLAPRYVAAAGSITAVDACPLFKVDISIEVSLSVSLDFPNPGTLRTMASLTWDADSTWCDVLSTFVLGIPFGIGFHVAAENEVSDTILGKSLSPGGGFVEVNRDDSSITFERLGGSPPPPSAEFIETYSAVTREGIQIGGTIVPKTAAKLVAEFFPAVPSLDLNCNLRSVSYQFDPARVLLRTNRTLQPRIFDAGVVCDPAGAWSIAVDLEIVSPASPHPAHTVITFEDPSMGRLPVGTHTSAYLFTDHGVRWVNLGMIPEIPEVVPEAAIRLMNTYCDSIANPWTGVAADLTWVDPLLDPDYEYLGAIEKLRLWSIGLRALPNSARIEFVAVSRQGKERELGVVEGQTDVALELVTELDETISMRINHPFAAPAPTVSSSFLYATPRRQEGKAIPPTSGAFGAILEREQGRGRLPWATAVLLGKSAVAIALRGEFVVGMRTRARRTQ